MEICRRIGRKGIGDERNGSILLLFRVNISAGIVAEKYNTIPHIIFFSNKPIPEFSESDEERIYELCATINSDVEKIHNNEVNAIIKDGKIMNEKEYVLSKRLGIFAIPDVKNKENLYLNLVGIIRGEKNNG